ncbi:MAG: D-alanyl-D-alanine carboxypeptidase family protein, partial [Suilimivivens sp.]
EQEERMNLPIQSNEIENWPDGPAIGAEGAVLLEANTGVILYAKNIHEKLYPASTTKLMTCLLAAENSSMDEIVTFSHDAVFGIEKGSSNIGIDAGQAMPMEECLYGILVASANEVAAAVAEHIAGSQEAFASMMNEKAKELGCTDTHFTNPHGLFDENHYTSAYDLALIARAFFQNELLSKVGNTPSHHFVATADQPDDFVVRNKHQLITGDVSYEGIKGGKTGYTDEARQTLVTCAEKNGMKLICVVMKEESPNQFSDTVKLLDYGFNNFTVTNVSENETKYNIDNTGFFHTSYDIFGNSQPILSLNKNSYLILPKTADFEELTSEISYDTSQSDEVARINYYYHDTYVGTACIDLAGSKNATYDFDSEPVISEENSLSGTDSSEMNVIFINIKIVLLVIVIIAVLLIIIFIIRDIVTNYAFVSIVRRKKKKKYWISKKRNRKKGSGFPSSRFKDFDF